MATLNMARNGLKLARFSRYVARNCSKVARFAMNLARNSAPEPDPNQTRTFYV